VRLTVALRGLALTAGVLTLFLSACGGAGSGSPAGSGIQGLVTAGPSCPNAQQASPCPDRPVAAAQIQVLDGSGRQVASVVSDSAGRFSVDLSPGTYVVQPVSNKPLPGVTPTAASKTVRVVQGSYTSVQLQLDTGIR
jgi:hypothetical protein